MKIIIAGAGAVGTHLAKLLAGEDPGHYTDRRESGKVGKNEQ